MAVTATSLAGVAATGTGTSKTLSVGSTPSGTRLIVGVALWSSGNATVSGVTAPDGTTALTKMGGPTNAFNYHVSLWSVNAPSGFSSGNVTVTFSVSISDGAIIMAGYLSGSDTGSDPRDGGASGTNGQVRDNSPTTPWDSGNVTTANANDGLVGVAFADGNVTDTPGGSYAEIIEQPHAGNAWDAVMTFLEVTSTGTYNATGTWSGTPGADAELIVAFKAASGAAATSLPVMRRRRARGLYLR